MAEKLVSPGVFTRENDLSFIAQGVGAIGGAIVGPFKQGPAFKPTIITSPSELEDIFGAADGTYYTELTAQNYLRETGLVTICRVAGTEGYIDNDAVYLVAATSGSGSKIVGTLFGTETPLDTEAFTSFTSGNFVLDGFSASVVAASTASIDDVFGVSPLGTKGVYAHTFFKNHGFVINSTTTINAYIQPQEFDFEATTALTPMIQSQLISGDRYDLFQFETLADGNVENKRFKVSISNVKAAGDINGSDYGTFNVFVRAYDDTDKRQTVLEQYNNVSLNPSATNYIARVIGDTKSTIDNTGKITTIGDWANKSKYIRVKMATASDSNPVVAVPFGHEAYTNPFATDEDDNLVPAVTFTTGSKDSSTKFSGIDLEGNSDNSFYLNALPNNAEVGANIAFGLDTQVGLSLTSNAIASELSKRQFTIAFQGGFDGVNPTTPINKGADISNTNVQGFDLSTSAAAGTAAYKKCLDALSNTDEWDINLLVLPGVNHNDHSAVTQYAMDICENRADTFYIMDPAGQAASIGDVTAVAESLDTNYAAVYYPWLKTIDTNTGKLITVPPSVLLPRVYAANDATAAEWFAPAGLNRGGVIGAAAVLNRLTHAERDELYEAKVNPIAQFPGQGISAFGQKTLQSRPSALDRINVRRLLITVKKFIASTSRFLIFEQNTTDTRNSFLNTVNPYLESIQQRQGLYAFRVVMDDTNNTPDVIDRNILKGAIFLQPTKTAEFIQIDFNVLPTGASFNA
jgi:phage tail sheath protein FI